MVRSINDRFTATMTNNVRWQDAPSCSADAGCAASLLYDSAPQIATRICNKYT